MKLLILLASLALARATVTTTDNKNDEHFLLRGAAAGSVDVVTSSNQQDQDQHQHRSLQVILDPGGADCVPHSSGDGTFVCTIRTAIQQTQSAVDDATSLNYNRVLREAGYVRYFNGKEHMCVPTSAAAAVPGSGGAVTTAAGPPPSTGTGVDLGMDMGMDSSGTQAQEQGGAFVTTTLTNTNPVPIDTTPITAVVFSNPVVVVEPEPEPEPEEAPMRSEQVGITLASAPHCPVVQPGNGSGCQFYTHSSKCPYQSTQFASGWLTCGCTKDEGWRCREYTLPAFSF
mmetsp:Transcript_26016/g.29106  ORF Transcript_26016/g.29106 Transcript_26016/m.29106 type:complete len:286 (+) Transcript_26016:92-949(+)